MNVAGNQQRHIITISLSLPFASAKNSTRCFEHLSSVSKDTQDIQKIAAMLQALSHSIYMQV